MTTAYGSASLLFAIISKILLLVEACMIPLLNCSLCTASANLAEVSVSLTLP